LAKSIDPLFCKALTCAWFKLFEQIFPIWKPYVIVIKCVKNEVNTSVDSASFGRLKINRQN
jgi:hypothetical protein